MTDRLDPKTGMGGRREKETRMLLLVIHHTGEGDLVDDEDVAGF